MRAPLILELSSLAEHRALREVAARLGARVSGCDCSALPHHTGRSIAALLDLLLIYLDREERELGPMLDHNDAWGPARAARRGEHRRAEVARIGEMLARLAHPLEDGLRLHLLRFVDWLDGELGAEEQAELHERLLRDDSIVDDTGGG